MKYYVFLQGNEVMGRVKAANHDQAVAISGFEYTTPYYSEKV